MAKKDNIKTEEPAEETDKSVKDEVVTEASADDPDKKDATEGDSSEEKNEDEEEEPLDVDPNVASQKELIDNSVPTTDLEIALKAELDRQMIINERLRSEIYKLKNFVSKRKQTYKRKRKDGEAPRKSLSGYNLFVRERFAKLSEQNKKALESGDVSEQLERVPPHKKVAEAARAWKALSAEEKAKYDAMAKPDQKRYEEEMTSYQAPEKGFRKRNKTGYNLFFSAHVLRMKNSETGVPSERGSVARIVGDAWKKMSAAERDFYEREADKQNEVPANEEDPLKHHSHLPGIDRPPAGDAPPQANGPPPNYHDREYMGPPPGLHHGGYYERYGPPPPPGYGGYDYYGYPPPGGSPSARGQPPHDPYAYGPPPPGY